MAERAAHRGGICGSEGVRRNARRTLLSAVSPARRAGLAFAAVAADKSVRLTPPLPHPLLTPMPDLDDLFDDANGDLALGDLEAAVEKYRRCTELDPAFFDGWHALGMALMKLGRFPEAIDAGLKSVELHPNDQLAWSSLSLFYVRNNQIREAEAAGAKAKILSWGGKLKKDQDVVD